MTTLLLLVTTTLLAMVNVFTVHSDKVNGLDAMTCVFAGLALMSYLHTKED